MMMQPPSTSAEPIVVNVTPTEVAVQAGGEPAEMIAYVRNAGMTVDQYSVEIENLDASWYTIMVQSVSLFPGDTAPITIKLHPPKGSATRAGHHTFVVRARSQADPSLVGVTKAVVVVASFANFQIEMAPKRFTGRKGKYRLNITNGGNSETQLELTGRNPEENLSYHFSKSTPTVNAGAKASVPFTVKPRGFKIVGEQEKYQFIINARPVDGTEKEAKEVQGELVHTPMFKSWRLPIILLVLFALGLLWFIFRPPLNPCDVRYYAPAELRVPFYAGILCRGVVNLGGQTNEPVKEDCKSGAGFAEVRENYPDQIGGCVEDEWYDTLNNAHQQTQNGQLMYIQKGAESQIYFFSKEKIYTFVDCQEGTFIDCNIVEVKNDNPDIRQ